MNFRGHRKPRLRRSFRRRYGRRGKSATVGRIRGIQAFPERQFVKLRYSQDVSLTLGTIGSSTPAWVFRGNSIYDPDQSSTGHAPYAYDIYAQVYNRYRVYGSKIRCRFSLEAFNVSTGNTGGAKFYVVPFNTTSAVAATLDEAPGVRRKIWAAAYSRSPSIGAYCSTAKAWGISKQTAKTNAEFSAGIAGNPGSEWYWIVAARHIDDTAVAAASMTVRVNVTVVYYAVLYDRNWLPQS